MHPAALAHREIAPPPPVRVGPRDAALAAALVARNASWNNPVEGEIRLWQAGAEVVVSGQQPGLLGGPLLTLVKACAVAAEVSRRRAAGQKAVGFFWLATNDDDLPEMGWGRVSLGEELITVREGSWRRGERTAGHVLLTDAVPTVLEDIAARAVGERAQEVLALARRCYQPETPLGDATGRFLGQLLRGLGVVLVDALEPALAAAAQETLLKVLSRLPEAWSLLAEGDQAMRSRGWPVPLRLTPGRLPIFRLRHGCRERLASQGGACPLPLLREVERHPAGFTPNVWLRPLLQDAALHTSVAFLGGAELAYHLQGQQLWELAGLPRPAWQLRPHVTVVTAAERRLATQLRLQPADVLRRRPPRQSWRGRPLVRQQATLARLVEARLARLAAGAQRELPMLTTDIQATAAKLAAALEWLQHRTALAQMKSSEVEALRWRRLVAFVRPDGLAQERRLSVLGPLLRLGIEWPQQLVAAIDPRHPGMHLLHWGEGGPW